MITKELISKKIMEGKISYFCGQHCDCQRPSSIDLKEIQKQSNDQFWVLNGYVLPYNYWAFHDFLW